VLVVHLTNNRLLLLLLRPLHILPLLINNPPWLLPRPLTQPDLQAINNQVPQHPFWPQLLLTRLRVTNSPLWLLQHPLIQPHLRAISNPPPLLLSLPQPIAQLRLLTNSPLPPRHLLPLQLTTPVVHLINNRLLLLLPRLLHTLPLVINNPPWPLPHPLTQLRLRAIINPLPHLL